MIPLHQLPDDQNTPVSNLTSLSSSRTLVSALVLPHPPEGEELPETYLAMVTRSGRIKRVTLEDLTTAASRGVVTAMGVEAGDQLAWVVETGGRHELLLATRQGKAIRFSEEDVRPMGLSAAGVLAIKLDKDDAVVGMGVARDGAFVVSLTELGYGKRVAVKSFPSQKRYGGGVQAVKLTKATGPVAVATVAGEDDYVVLTTSTGRVTRLPVQGLHSQGRAASGYRIRQDTKDRYLEPDKHGVPVMLTVLAGTKAASSRANADSPAPETPAETKAAKTARTRSRTTKQASTRSSGKSKQTGRASSAKKTTTRRSTKSSATSEKKDVETPAPMKSAPPKSRKKPAPAKRRSVRSVPK